MPLANRDFTISWAGLHSSDSKCRNSYSYVQIQISFWVVRDGWCPFRRNKLAVCREFNHSVMDVCPGIAKSIYASTFFQLSLIPVSGLPIINHYFQTAQIKTYVTKTFPSLSFLHWSPKKHDPEFLLKSCSFSMETLPFSWLLWAKVSSWKLLTAEISHNKKSTNVGSIITMQGIWQK